MARTLDETNKEERTDSDRSPGKEAEEDIRDIDWPKILRAPPDVRVDPREERRRDDIGDIEDRLSNELLQELGLSLDGLNELIRGGFELEGLSQTELMRVMAERANANLLVNSVIMEQQIAQLVSLNDIAKAVEPSADIVVDGINETDSADVPEPVVPDSNESAIPITHLYVRAEPSNSEDIFIGDDNMSPKTGYVLRPGEEEMFEMDFREQILWMASADSGQTIQVLGFL